MNWLNLHTSTLESEDFVFSTPEQQATWLNLQRYCVVQENGGVIAGARSWTDQQCQYLLRVRSRDLRIDSRLWSWEGNDLRVKYYQDDQESLAKARRCGAKITNSKRHAERGAQRDAERDAERHAGAVPKVKTSNVKESQVMELATSIPSEPEIVAFGVAWAGDMARGIPAGMPEAWCLDWYAWRCSPAGGPWPADWRTDMVRRFTAMWLRRDRRTLKPGAGVDTEKNGEKTAGLSVNVAAIAAQQQRRAWEEELHKLRVANDALDQAGAEIPAADKAREKELERLLKEGTK